MKVEEIRKMSQLDNPAQIAQVKRDIARVMTIQREKQLAANK